MNNGTHRNSLPPTRSGGNGTATAVRRSPNDRSPSPNGNGNGTRAQHNPPATPDRNPALSAPEALHWDALAPRVTEALGQPLDPQLVSQRKGRGGRKFDYIEGHTAIDQANKIFGFGGWGCARRS
ncbi:MAG: Rad52/Rad22 family DNA repair protein [Chloroflexi bacterium]|nr:Rad52/Rad22 family DNA repair protein [Chloroflexota bacterium]